MLYQDLMPSHQVKVDPLVNKMKSFTQKIIYKGTTVDRVIIAYKEDRFLQHQREVVINHYIALSIASFGNMSTQFHFSKDLGYERSISGHEYVIYRELVDNHKIKCIRQTLIGDTHADFYLPAFHACLEPSSANHFSRSKRARGEEATDRFRVKINNLHSFRIEKYSSTRQDLVKYVNWMRLNTNIKSDEAVIENLYAIACHTLPYFIPLKYFIDLVTPKGLVLVQ